MTDQQRITGSKAFENQTGKLAVVAHDTFNLALDLQAHAQDPDGRLVANIRVIMAHITNATRTPLREQRAVHIGGAQSAVNRLLKICGGAEGHHLTQIKRLAAAIALL